MIIKCLCIHLFLWTTLLPGFLPPKGTDVVYSSLSTPVPRAQWGRKKKINTHISNFLPLWLVYHSPNQYLQKYINEAACVTKSGSIFLGHSQKKKRRYLNPEAVISPSELFQGTEPSHLTYLEGSERKGKTKDFPGWLALYRSPK